MAGRGDRELPALDIDRCFARRNSSEGRATSAGNASRTENGGTRSGSYKDFNVVTHEGRTFAPRMSLGPVDAEEGEDALRQRFPEDFTIAAPPQQGARSATWS